MVTISYSDDYGSTFTDISDYVMEVSWKKSYGLDQNTFKLVVDPSFFENIAVHIKPGYEIKITDQGSLQFYGMITSFKKDVGDSEQGLITGSDASMDLFATQVSIGKTNKTASEIITEIVSEYQGLSTNISAETVINGGFVFPTDVVISNYYALGKRFYDVLMELSLSWRTDGRNHYIFYVDNENRLHFEPMGRATYSVLSQYCISFSQQFDTSNKFNHAVIDCGEDLNGDRILASYYDPVGYHRMKRISSRYFDESGIATKIKQENPSITNEELIEAARSVGEMKAEAMVRYMGSVRKKWTAVVPGTYVYSPSANVHTNLAMFGDYLWLLRSVEQTIGNNGWFTKLTMEEMVE